MNRSFCRLCDGRCALKVTVEGGRVVKVEADPDPPAGRGGACRKARIWPEILHHPHRLRRPLIRKGARGEGKWQEASWQQALDFVLEQLLALKERHGPEALALCLGHPKGLEGAFCHRFARVFGTPNVVSSGHICHVPGEVASIVTLGAPCFLDPEGVPRTLVLWGVNFPDTRYGSLSYGQLQRALREGARLIVVDPKRTSLCNRADLWVRVRPGGDWALALGLLKVVVEEGLYDREFVEKWTVGFDKLEAFLKGVDAEELSRISWVDPEIIRRLARMYAQDGPSAIQWGNALDHTPNSFQTFRVLVILKAITGNLDVKGGEWVTYERPPVKPFREFALLDRPELQRQTHKVDPEFVFLRRTVARQSFLKAVLQGKPYPIKGAMVFGSNPLLTYPDARKAKEALQRLEFLLVADLFMTPSAALADVVLPVAANFEFDEIAPYPPFDGFLLAYPKLVEPSGESWPDYKILNELGKRLNPRYFFDDEREALDYILSPGNLSFEDFKRIRVLRIKGEEKGYERRGFKTRSGKVEIYCERLKGLGLEPLLNFIPPPDPSDRFPLLLTSAKEFPYLHSEGRWIEGLRRMRPEPVVELNPATARQLGLAEGDWAVIETERGRIRQKVAFNDSLDPRVVFVAYGWWFPEEGIGGLYGWEESNLNILTSSDPPYEPALGSVTLRGIPCRVWRDG